ncbi:NADH dehydrogenase I, chain M [gamma proteobacterium HdN1]|nr:NADH dehydrogenase I, chain M [gamma proteobacterium HdN1]
MSDPTLSNSVLPWLLFIPVIAGFLAWASERIHRQAPRWVSLAGMVLVGVLTLSQWPSVYPESGWWAQFQGEWVPAWGITFHLAMDGLSGLMVLLAALLGAIAVAASWNEVQKSVGLFHLHLSLMLAAVVGIFLAVDLFLFFVCWEVMLVPMYFLITLWGVESVSGIGRANAAIKMFIYGQGSGLLMLLGMLGLVFFHFQNTKVLTFDYDQLKGTSLAPEVAWFLMLGFFMAFVVKLPAVPFHGWLPDAHTHAPTGASVDITGLLIKTSAYGIIRFCLPLFPEASREFAEVAMWIGVVTIIYGGVLAYGQTHIKRLIAYISISHMGFILIGIYAFNELALQGVVVMMVAAALSNAALFVLAGQLYERLGTFDMRQMEGLWSRLPTLPPIILFFTCATLGLPGLGNFIGEFMVLFGAFKVAPVITAISTLGMVLGIVFSLALVHRTIYGPSASEAPLPAPNFREQSMLAVMMVLLLVIGLFPQPLLDSSAGAIAQVKQSMVPVTATASTLGE